MQDELAPDLEAGEQEPERDDADADFDVYTAEGDYLYGAGLSLVLDLFDRAGQELVDEAFRHPPGSSQQVLHPELVGSAVPTRPAPPEPQGEVVDEGVLGEVGLAHSLRADPQEPGGPQAGWRGDSYVTFRSHGNVCTLASVVVSDGAALGRLATALRDEDLGVTATGPGRLLLRSCA